MPNRFEQHYRFDRNDALTDGALNRRFLDLDLRLSGLEGVRIDWETALAVVQDRILGRSEEVIGSLRDRLIEITQLDWLVANSATARTLVEGADTWLDVVADDRALFAPGPFAVLSRSADPDDYAVVKTLAYDRELGRWDFRVEAVFGAAGPHSDWHIAAIAGSTLAQTAMLAEGKTARTEAVGAAGTTIADRTATGLDRVATGQDRVNVDGNRQLAQTAAETATTKAQQATDAAASIDVAAINASIVTAARHARAYALMMARMS